MKVLKRNQIIVLVIALMLISAGYLNFTSINNKKQEDLIPTSTHGEESIEYASIGDAKLVNANTIESIVPNDNIDIANSISEDNNTNKENNSIIENQKDNNISTTVSTTSKKTQEYFSSSRLNRETMYSQMLESYQKILENELISSDQKSIAQTEIKNINDIKNKIMICENLIKLKEIEDVIIFVNDRSISVIVRADEIKQEQIAQIQNIISREMQIEVDNIHISNK